MGYGFSVLNFGAREPWTVDGLDHVEQFDGLAHFVGLQRADQVQAQIRKVLAERWPLRLRLLDAVLAEDAVARV